VSSVLQDLVLLVQLQAVYDRIAAALQERQTAPPEVRELQDGNQRRQAELEELERQIATHRDELTQVRKKEQEWQLELEHFQRQRATVSNEREFTAVISEIDYANKALRESGDRRKELEQAIVDVEQNIETRRAARPEEEETQRSVVEAWERRKEELRQAVHEGAADAEKLELQLQPRNRARFLRLLESKRGTAVAEVIDGSCSLCHFALRPHLQQRVRRGEELISCEHCHRILYLAEITRSAAAKSEES
jgi:predicted  nucleic acid-binding Zn-ribbon protein